MSASKKLRLGLFFAVAASGLMAIIVWPQPHRATPTSDRPVVAATIFPLYDIVRQIGGDQLDYVLILPAGASPHTFETTPSQMTALQTTQVVYVIGHGLDSWISQLAAGTGAPIVTVDQGIVLRTDTDHEQSETDDHAGDGADPHYWLSFTNGQIMAQNVAADLTARFPESAAVFAVNLQRFTGEIAAADTLARRRLADISDRNLVTLHDAWYYFAAGLDLTVVGSLEPSAGREPTPQYLANLARTVKKYGVTTLYAEPQLATETLAAFLSDNDLRLATLDPLGGVADRDSYISTILYDVQIVADHQK